MPCAFVSKIEVSRWPVFGVAARVGGTIFIDRSSRASADAVALEIAGRLSSPSPSWCFPRAPARRPPRCCAFTPGFSSPPLSLRRRLPPAAIGYAAADGPRSRSYAGSATSRSCPICGRSSARKMFALMWRSGSRASILTGGPLPGKHRQKWKPCAPPATPSKSERPSAPP